MSVIMGVNGVNQIIGAAYLGAAGTNEGWSFSGAKLNVFAQPDEPATKDGLWIASPEKHSIGQITTKDSFIQGGTIRSTYDITNLNPLSITSGYLVDDHYLYYMRVENSTGTSIALQIYRYDFTTHTTAVKRIYNYFDATNHVFNQIRYSFIYRFNGLINFIISTNYNSGWYGVKGSFDPATFDTLDHIDTQSESNTSVGQYLASYPALAKNNDYCILCYYVVYSPSNDVEIIKFDYQTNTDSVIVQKEKSTSYAHVLALGGIYDNVLYYYADLFSTSGPFSVSSLSRYDLVNSCSLSDIQIPSTLSSLHASAGKYHILSFQNKLIIPFVNPFVVLDLSTLTEQTYAKNIYYLRPCFIYQNMFLFYVECDPSRYTILDFVSETLDPNQLAVLNGRDYSYKIISTAKMNYLRAVLNNAWWYDTDFREYPTYIGDGTSWTKIKN